MFPHGKSPVNCPNTVLGSFIQANFSRSFFPAIFSEKTFMRSGGKDASPGDLSLLFHIVKVVALVLFRSQDVAPPVNKPRVIGKLSIWAVAYTESRL